MKQKRKGSAILMVLMVSTILIILSAVVSSSLVSTTRGNSIQKRKSDYMYAAEGGIEQGVEKYNRSGAFAEFDVPFLETITEDPENGIEKVTVKYVVDPVNTSMARIISTVTRRTKKLAEIVLPINMTGSAGRSGNILENTIYVNDSINISSTGGSCHFADSQVTYEDGSSSSISFDGSLVGPTEKSEVNTIKPEFNHNISGGGVEIIVNSIDELWTMGELMSMSATADPLNTVGKINNGIGKFELNNLGAVISSGHVGSGYKLILVDSPKLTINLDRGKDRDMQYIVICTGEISIKSTVTLPYPYELIGSTLFGEKATIEGLAVVKFVGSPIKGNTPFHPLRTEQLDKLDELLNKYMKNWSSGGSGGSGVPAGTSDINYGEIEYTIL
ncbi:MAG: hypothetical protein RR585_05705 [Coprobacillus sp.]